MRPETIRRKLQAQKEKRQLAREQSRASKARDSFRPRKADRGHLVLVHASGKRDPQKRGKAGYLIYVTKTGKKRVIRDYKVGFKARKLKDLNPPDRPNLRRAIKEFQEARLEKLASGKAVVRRQGGFEVSSPGGNDFTGKTSKRLSKEIKRALEEQASHRTFLIQLNVLVELGDGSTQVITVDVPIDRPDHIAIEAEGIENFVRRKLYRYLAVQLAYVGYVTSGSANHVRRQEQNEGKEQEQWTINHKPWAGAEKEIVHIKRIDWQIQQSK